MKPHLTLWTTDRGRRHQLAALASAPPELEVRVLRTPEPETLRPHLAGAEFFVTERTGIVDAEMIRAAPRLRLILRLGSLAHDIDLAAAKAAGVAVCLRPQQVAIQVAEHVSLQMLALVKRLREAEAVAVAAADWGESQRTDEDTFAYNWSRRGAIGTLHGRTVGILGFGEIGAELARRLTGWGCRISYHRRRRLPVAVEAELGISAVERDELTANSDFLVNLLPYTLETNRSLGREFFGRMKPGAFFVSCGSGSVVDEDALADAVASGHLGGTALDTYEWEPIRPDNPLRQLAAADPHANVILTPHTAAGAPGASTRLTRADDYVPILQVLRGEEPEGRII